MSLDIIVLTEKQMATKEILIFFTLFGHTWAHCHVTVLVVAAAIPTIVFMFLAFGGLVLLYRTGRLVVFRKGTIFEKSLPGDPELMSPSKKILTSALPTLSKSQNGVRNKRKSFTKLVTRKVTLRGRENYGLGFTISRSASKLIQVQSVAKSGPAVESNRIHKDDVVKSLRIYFDKMNLEDAMTFLSYAGKYQVTVELEKAAERPADVDDANHNNLTSKHETVSEKSLISVVNLEKKGVNLSETYKSSVAYYPNDTHSCQKDTHQNHPNSDYLAEQNPHIEYKRKLFERCTEDIALRRTSSQPTKTDSLDPLHSKASEPRHISPRRDPATLECSDDTSCNSFHDSKKISESNCKEGRCIAPDKDTLTEITSERLSDSLENSSRPALLEDVPTRSKNNPTNMLRHIISNVSNSVNSENGSQTYNSVSRPDATIASNEPSDTRYFTEFEFTRESILI